MTTFVITIPGTFLRTADAGTRAQVALHLRGVDPHRTELGREEDLDLLTVNDDGTFSMRLEVTADASAEARRTAGDLAAQALRAAGFDESDAPLGPPSVTGIDNPA
ncbi:hypothetical protein GTY65_23795 [Streptomyces sp. SID8379]|uniref:hypothetical protein n=1 Tax=unclassified Streptomyces TaxID=2593676 RepID=UPI000375F782|nr:hypothetical protein [Streptomyces sp. HmicA12]MYW67071.1 hypothetical protein [Streptomyces sp. SID8379]